MRAHYSPFEGNHYGGGFRDGIRLLILGHSFYGDAWSPDAPSEVILQHHIPSGIRFFSDIEQIITGTVKSDSLEREGFWSRVAFTNLIQEPMKTANTPPTSNQWREAWACFPELIERTRPDLIFCFTKTGWDIQERFGSPFSDSINLVNIRNEDGPLAYRSDVAFLYNCESISSGYRVLAGRFNHPSDVRRHNTVSDWHNWALRLISSAPGGVRK